jgi:hypothetical protein
MKCDSITKGYAGTGCGAGSKSVVCVWQCGSVRRTCWLAGLASWLAGWSGWSGWLAGWAIPTTAVPARRDPLGARGRVPVPRYNSVYTHIADKHDVNVCLVIGRRCPEGKEAQSDNPGEEGQDDQAGFAVQVRMANLWCAQASVHTLELGRREMPHATHLHRPL